MTSKRLEALNALLGAFGTWSVTVDFVQTKKFSPAEIGRCEADRDKARDAVIAWVDQYGDAQRREGRRDAPGRVSSRVERGEK